MPVAEQRPAPEQIEADEVERPIVLAEQGQLDGTAQRRVAPLLRTLVWLQHTLSETRISLAKLKRLLFGKRTEKAPRKPPPDPANDSGDGQRAAHAGTDARSQGGGAPPGERGTSVAQTAEANANAPAADTVAAGDAGKADKP